MSSGTRPARHSRSGHLAASGGDSDRPPLVRPGSPHNGVIHSLDQAIRFYNTPDTRPELWYSPVGGRAKIRPDPGFPRYGLVTTQYIGGTVQKFDYLPAAYRANLDKQRPLDGRAAGSEPPMTEPQVSDLISFLRALTDADQALATAPTPGACTA